MKTSMYCLTIILCMLAMSCIHTNKGTTTNYYNEKGKYAGKSEAQSNKSSERFYDTKGKFIGKSKIYGNSVRYYDKEGKYIGKSNKLNFNQ